MLIDKIEHKQLFLQIFDNASFSGRDVPLAFELRQAIVGARVITTGKAVPHLHSVPKEPKEPEGGTSGQGQDPEPNKEG